MLDVDLYGNICSKASLLGWLPMQDENKEHGEPGGFGNHNCSCLLGSLSSPVLSPIWPLLATVGLDAIGHLSSLPTLSHPLMEILLQHEVDIQPSVGLFPRNSRTCHPVFRLDFSGRTREYKIVLTPTLIVVI